MDYCEHGWHSGIVVPAANVNRVLPSLEMRFTQPNGYKIGDESKRVGQSHRDWP